MRLSLAEIGWVILYKRSSGLVKGIADAVQAQTTHSAEMQFSLGNAKVPCKDTTLIIIQAAFLWCHLAQCMALFSPKRPASSQGK